MSFAALETGLTKRNRVDLSERRKHAEILNTETEIGMLDLVGFGWVGSDQARSVKAGGRYLLVLSGWDQSVLPAVDMRRVSVSVSVAIKIETFIFYILAHAYHTIPYYTIRTNILQSLVFLSLVVHSSALSCCLLLNLFTFEVFSIVFVVCLFACFNNYTIRDGMEIAPRKVECNSTLSGMFNQNSNYIDMNYS